MTTTYCQATDVAAKLQLVDENEQGQTVRKIFDENTSPTIEEVEQWINEIEDWIDDYCYHSWRNKQVTEYKDNMGLTYPRGALIPAIIVDCRHRNIKDLDSAQGDKLEVFDGNDWDDLLTSPTITKGLGYGDGSYWVDTQEGEVYVFAKYGVYGPNTIRITYRYGETTVPESIKNACALLTAINLLQSDDYIVQFPGNPERVSLDAKATNFENRAYKILNRYREHVSI